MADYIDREELIKAIMNDEMLLDTYGTADRWEETIAKINSMPSVDAVEQKHGHWELAYVMSDNDHREFCSNCHYLRFRNNSADWRYCPYCGSKMDEVTEDDG